MAQKILGPTFPAELKAAGCASVSLGDDGLLECHDQQNRLVRITCDVGGTAVAVRTPDSGNFAQLTDAQIAAIEAVLTAHDPSKQLPEWTGFLVWLDGQLTPDRLTTMGNAYNPFFGWCQFGNTPKVQWAITDAKAKGVITAAEYAIFQTGNTKFNLGMTLS